MKRFPFHAILDELWTSTGLLHYIYLCLQAH